MAWRLARALETLRSQVNIKWPNRSKDSDGSVGDTSHAARPSDHNPVNGVVHAIDITHDPKGGFDSYAFADLLLKKQDRRMKYCLAPGSRVLNANLEWKGIETFLAGDALLAFDEFGAEKPWHARSSNKARMGGQKLRTAIVEEVETIRRPCFELSTSKGVVVASSDHQWLTDRAYEGKYRTWIETSELKPGIPLQYFAAPWEVETDFDAGWLAGLFDGEGCLSRPNGAGWQLSVAQRDGAVLDRAIEILDRLGVNFEVYNGDGDCRSIGIRGGLAGILRFLGRIPTVRLTEKAIEQRIWEGYSITGTGETAVIEDIKYIGEQDVVAMQTSSRTFIAEGIFSHNCISNRRIGSGPAGPSPGVWRKYTGSNPHDHHCHISVVPTALGDATEPWNIDGIGTAAPEAVKDFVPPPATVVIGSIGKDVEKIQALLGCKVTGAYQAGSETEFALKLFQVRHQLTPDGRAGPQFWKAIS